MTQLDENNSYPQFLRSNNTLSKSWTIYVFMNNLLIHKIFNKNSLVGYFLVIEWVCFVFSEFQK